MIEIVTPNMPAQYLNDVIVVAESVLHWHSGNVTSKMEWSPEINDCDEYSIYGVQFKPYKDGFSYSTIETRRDTVDN